MVFDPLERAEIISKIVCKNIRRKYYRFRISRQYAGEATADCLGCMLDCAYCWAWEAHRRMSEVGDFYHPEEVFSRLLEMAKERNLHRIRLSGGEPTLHVRHFATLVRLIGEEAPDVTCIVETNGIMIYRHPWLANILADYPNMEVRVSIKGYDEKSFEKVTGADRKYFWWQIDALKILIDRGVYAYGAAMWDICGAKGVKKLMKILLDYGIDGLELECLIRYDFVMERIRERGIKLRGS
ncbi:MAG: radical SAM protein [Candidatus Baldrarchaeia archaeon]